MDAERESVGVVMLISLHGVFGALKKDLYVSGWIQSFSPFLSTQIIRSSGDWATNGLLAGSTGGAFATSTDGNSWNNVTTGFGTSAIFAATRGPSLYVIGGADGKLATSTNGTTWTLRTSGFGANPIQGLTYHSGSGLYIAVGGNGQLATSPNGTTWTLRTSSFGLSFINAVATDGTTIVAVGDSGKLATSTNGTTWTQRTSSFGTSRIYTVSYSKNLFVAAGETGKLATASAASPTLWVQKASGFGTRTIWASGGSSTSKFAVAGANGLLSVSNDGEYWGVYPSSFTASDTIYSMYVGQNRAVMGGTSGKLAVSVREA